jgi:hypothetical protein
VDVALIKVAMMPIIKDRLLTLWPDICSMICRTSQLADNIYCKDNFSTDCLKPNRKRGRRSTETGATKNYRVSCNTATTDLKMLLTW